METPVRPLPRRALPPLQSDGKSATNISTLHMEPDASLEKIESSAKTSKHTRPPRRKRSPRPSQPLKSEESLLKEVKFKDEGDELSTRPSQQRRARTRRREASKAKTASSAEVVTNGHALTSMLSEDDVVPVDRIDNYASMTTLPGVAGGGSGSSQPQAKVYVQTASGFTSHTKEWLSHRQAAMQKAFFDGTEERGFVDQTAQVALTFHRGFIFLTLICHGILAGLAIWEVVVAFSLSSRGADNFFLQYSSLAQPTQTTFFFLITFCLVSAMDRFNFAKPGRNFLIGLVAVEPGAWMVLVYFLAFMFNVGSSGLDYWLGNISFQSQINGTVVEAYPNNDPTGTLSTWHVINVLRASFSVLGWILIALRPKQDNTFTSLFSIEEEN